MNNPFELSNDNKRYYTFNYYGKMKYGTKLYKVPLDSSFTCPNRDGTISNMGCIYCSGGSNAFPALSDKDIYKQYCQRKNIFENKWPNGKAMAYFQSYSNTYGSLDKMKSVYQPFIDDKEIVGLVIATRCDCLDDQKIGYLDSLTKEKEIWLELGLQSIHDKTTKEMNRGHNFASFLEIINKLAKTNIKISVHLINGWPSETKEMMLETAKVVGKLPIHAVKFHMLHIIAGTPLASIYENKNFQLLDKDEYVQIVAQQLTFLRNDIIIERLTGDGLADSLIAPLWTKKKVSVINDIDKYLVNNNLFQGCNYEKEGPDY